MAHFVILEHDHPNLHWDFMLENAGVLKSWRLTAPPELANQHIKATAIGDHRLAYLDYEGPVSGNRGQVRRWERGTYRLVAGAFGGSPLVLDLEGEKVAGRVVLEQRAGDEWSLTFLGAPT